MITQKEIDSLKAFGYKVFEVSGWKTGTHCFDYDGKVSSLSDCPSYTPHKGEQKAWEAALRFHKKRYTNEIAVLQDEIDKAFEFCYKLQRKNRLLMKKITATQKQQKVKTV